MLNYLNQKLIFVYYFVIFQSLSRAVANSQSIEFLFRRIGILSIKNGKVKMKFFKGFVNSLDGFGGLLKTMENVRINRACCENLFC